MKIEFSVFDQRQLIRSVAERWRRQYPDSREDVQAALDALDLSEATAEQIDKIIGNQSWTHLFCSSCCDYTNRGVTSFGYEQVNVCAACLKHAVEAISPPPR
jgi:hypothetical protein